MRSMKAIHICLLLLTVLCLACVAGCSSDGAPAEEVEPDIATPAAENPVMEDQPMQPPTEAAPSQSTDVVYYATTEDLYQAQQASQEQGAFTEIIDLFPELVGEDTMWAAFVPPDHPNFQVFYYAFYTPAQSFHELVYGYVVKNLETGELKGYFDGDANQTFEQETMSPTIDFGAYDALATQGQDI